MENKMCNCIEDTNNDPLMIESNTQIMLPLFGPQRALIVTMKLDEKKRGKPKYFFASYCPLCGEKYKDKDNE